MRRGLAAGAAAVLLALALMAPSATASPEEDREAAKQRAEQAVENADGSPRTASDPAVRAQQGLARAAAQRTTRRMSDGKPVLAEPGAAAAHGLSSPPPRKERTDKLKRSQKVDPAQVLSPEAARGGCLLEYGRDGQCLPVVPPSQAEHVAAGHQEPTWECGEVRTFFPDGLPVRSGADPQALDSSGDGLACGPEDE